MVKIVQKGHKALQKQSLEIKKEEFNSSKLKKVLSDMKEALESQDDGVALAAPQIGENLRIFVISWKVFATMDKVDIGTEANLEALRKKYNFKAFINPEIVKCSKEKEWLDEGCLSVRPLYGEVERSKKCRVRTMDESGKSFEVGGSGLLAQIFQHEIDHLDGVLFTEKARNLKEVYGE
jgi:peptide deformylase